MINKQELIGHVGQKPELMQTEGGVPYCRVSLATNHSFKDKNGEYQSETTWHNLVFWRAAAERAEKYQKGDVVYAEGRLRKFKHKDQNYTETVVSYARVVSKKFSGDKSPIEPKETISPDSAAAADIPAPASDDLPF